MELDPPPFYEKPQGNLFTTHFAWGNRLFLRTLLSYFFFSSSAFYQEWFYNTIPLPGASSFWSTDCIQELLDWCGLLATTSLSSSLCLPLWSQRCPHLQVSHPITWPYVSAFVGNRVRFKQKEELDCTHCDILGLGVPSVCWLWWDPLCTCR